MPFHAVPPFGKLSPRPPPGQGGKLQTKQTKPLGGRAAFAFLSVTGSNQQYLLHQPQLFPFHGKQLRELLPEYLQRLRYRLQFGSRTFPLHGVLHPGQRWLYGYFPCRGSLSLTDPFRYQLQAVQSGGIKAIPAVEFRPARALEPCPYLLPYEHVQSAELPFHVTVFIVVPESVYLSVQHLKEGSPVRFPAPAGNRRYPVHERLYFRLRDGRIPAREPPAADFHRVRCEPSGDGFPGTGLQVVVPVQVTGHESVYIRALAFVPRADKYVVGKDQQG